MVQEQGVDCGIPNTCSRKVPRWLVAIDNLPTFALFVLGMLIIWRWWWLSAIVFISYCILSITLFWGVICPYCHHFKTKACPCGYGSIAPKFFKPKLSKGKGGFRKVFQRNIAIMFPCWVAPLLVGVYLIFMAYSVSTLVLLIAFCIDGFALIPAISVFVGCRDCEVKDQCPWMKRGQK